MVDATNVQPEARKPLVELARQYHCLPVAIVFDLPEKLCQERNTTRSDRNFGPHVIRQQRQQLQQSIAESQARGIPAYLRALLAGGRGGGRPSSAQPLWNNRKHEHGPFDIIGDVHGCFDELVELLRQLGYQIVEDPAAAHGYAVAHPEGRKAVFLGDLVDRGPKIPAGAAAGDEHVGRRDGALRAGQS